MLIWVIYLFFCDGGSACDVVAGDVGDVVGDSGGAGGVDSYWVCVESACMFTFF